MNTLRNTGLRLLAAASIALPLTAQSGSLPLAPNLPANTFATVAKNLSSLDIAGAVRSALNSDGDSMTLDLSASGSVALIAVVNTGFGMGFDVEITRVASDRYEVAMTQSQAMSMGVEVYEGLEMNTGITTDQKVVFAFDSLQDLGEALENMAFAARASLGAVMNIVERYLLDTDAMMEELRFGVVRATETLVTSQEFQTAQLRIYQATQRTLSNAQVAANHASRAAAIAYRVKRNIEARYNAASWWKRPVLAASRAIARTQYSALARGSRRAAEVLKQARRKLARDYSSLLSAQRNVRTYRLRLQNSESRRARLAADREDARTLRASGTAILVELVEHLAAVEFGIGMGAGGELSLGLPGVSLANSGLSLSHQVNMGMSARITLHNGRMNEIRITVRQEMVGAGQAGFHLGADVEAMVFAEMSAIWSRGPRAQSFVSEGVEAVLGLDLDVAALAGTGVALTTGVGRQIRIEMNNAEISGAWSALTDAVRNPTPRALRNALRNVRGTVTSQDHWRNGIVAELGGSVAGYGFNFDGSLTFDDAGSEFRRNVSVADIVASIMDPVEVGVIADTLRSRR